MESKQFAMDWTKKDTAKSAWLFFMHFILLVALWAGILLGNKLSYIVEYLKENGAYYLYALICVMLLVIIMYLYFFFEDKENHRFVELKEKEDFFKKHPSQLEEFN